MGIKETAEILGWDKRKLAVYIQRGKLPKPIQRLASGPVWRRSDIEEFAKQLAESRRVEF